MLNVWVSIIGRMNEGERKDPILRILELLLHFFLQEKQVLHFGGLTTRMFTCFNALKKA